MSWIAIVVLLLPARPGPAETEALRDPSRTVRERAIAALAAPDRPIEDLVALLADESARVREGACEALAQRGDPVAIPPLLVAGSHEAARACVRIAERKRLDLPTIAALATPAMRAHLRRAHGDAVHERLGRITGGLQLARPQIHRAHLAGGSWTQRVVLSIARDPGQPPAKRAHALHVAQLLRGRALHDEFVRRLDDPVELVRESALTLLWRLHTDAGNRELVKLLDRGRQFDNGQVSLLISSVEQGAKPTTAGLDYLATRIRKGSASLAASAAAVLIRHDRARGLALLTARVRDEIHRSDGPAVALFFLRCGTPTRELKALAAETKDPLARIAAMEDSKAIVKALEAHLDPWQGASEWIRVRVVPALLTRHAAPWEMRARFARGVLSSDVASWRGTGLGQLAGAPEEVLRPFQPRLLVLLDDPSEGVRVRAAVLALPRAKARRVLWSALYDGDLRTAWTAAPALDPALSRRTPVEERRRRAREALAALDSR